MPFEHPGLLLLIIPVIAALLFVIRKDFVKRLKRGDLRKQLVRQRTFILITRTIIFTLLIIAASSPFSLDSVLKQGDPSITVLVDNSSSMEVLDTSAVPSLIEELEGRIPVRVRNFGSGTVSPVGDVVLAATTGNDNILLVSDGHSNTGRRLGDMAVVAASLNSTINAISIDPARDDASVVITGPRLTTNAEDNTFNVIVSQVGSERNYQLVVSIGGEEALNDIYSGSASASITKKFAEGYHTIKAEVVVNDHLRQNNVFYKTVKVEQKPGVLFVTKRDSPMSGILNTLYRTSTTSGLAGQDLDGFSAVILNDIPVSEVDTDRLGEYVIDGNGLVVIGGRNSYDRGSYKDSVFEGMLPVRVGKGTEGKRNDVSVVLLIDISQTTGARFGAGSAAEVQEVEKALALGIIDDLRPQDKVAVVAFNSEAFLVSGIVPVLGSAENVKDRVTRLVSGGSTQINAGIKAAREILGPLEGSRSIILISDGKSGLYVEDLHQAGITSNLGIKIYAVGVGEGTDARHMQDIASVGNGYYFEPDETERLKVIFGESEEAADSDSFPIEVVNSHHFITHNFAPAANVNGFNQVVPKPNADLLLATSGNNPILTSSRLGLGRIVSLSTDDGSAWASQLLNSRNSVVVTRGINWAIGDLGRNKDFDVDVRDAYLGDEMQVNVVSSSEPSHRTLKFSKIGKRLYSASFTPQSTGLQDFFGAVAAVNYPLEYAVLGMNSELDDVIGVTGGKLFNPADAGAIVEKVKQDSRRVVAEPQTFSWMFLLAALVVFLFEVAVRRIQEGRRR